jgi:hypothetical protein
MINQLAEHVWLEQEILYKNQMMSGYKEPVIPFINGKNLMDNFNEYLSSYKLHKRSIPYLDCFSTF